MLSIAEQRAAHQPSLELLTPRDIVDMLKETLPRKPEGKETLVTRINKRYDHRRGAIESISRTQPAGSGYARNAPGNSTLSH